MEIIEITREIIMTLGLIVLLLVCFVVILKSVKLVKKQQAVVLERFGSLQRVLMPGVRFSWPFFEQIAFTLSLAERRFTLTRQKIFLADQSAFMARIELIYYIENVDAYLAYKCMPEPQLEKHVQAICSEHFSHYEQKKVLGEIDLLSAKILKVLQDKVLALGLRINSLQIMRSQIIAAELSSKQPGKASQAVEEKELASWSSKWLIAKIKEEQEDLLRRARERTE